MRPVCLNQSAVSSSAIARDPSIVAARTLRPNIAYTEALLGSTQVADSAVLNALIKTKHGQHSVRVRVVITVLGVHRRSKAFRGVQSFIVALQQSAVANWHA